MRKRRRYWGVISPHAPAAAVAQSAHQQELMGLEGCFAPQVYGPPFLPLAAAATSTRRLLLATGIAIAFTRSPFETAMAAIDLDRMSEGRFVLGLGSSIKAWVEGFFGVPYGKPLEHLRETVDVIRLIVSRSHTGELTHYRGKYYNLDFRELQPTPPPLRTAIPIWIAALRGPLVALGAEIADGVIGHPIWSRHWLERTVAPQLAQGLARSGRPRDAVHLNCWFWATPNPDARRSVEDARACVAFYAGMKQYEEYFAAHGFREVCRRLQEGVRRGDYRGVAHLVPDEMASTFVVTGTPAAVRDKLEPVWRIADSVTLVPPIVSLAPEQIERYAATISDTFYGA